MRCFGDEWALVKAGRWVGRSQAFLLDVEEGFIMRMEHLTGNRRSNDPVFAFWVWEPTTGAVR